MPRINEPPVAEHRAARERALLDAAHALLLETGEAPSLPQVAERAGVGRTSMYHYFTSKQELLQAMVRDVFPRWTERITGAMAAAPTPADRLRAYAVANLELVDEGAHAVGSALAALAPGHELDERAATMHRELQAPLAATLEELGVETPADVAVLVNARALVNDPDVVLVDEPTAALDRRRSQDIVALLAQQCHERGVAGVLVTHDHDILHHCDRVLEMVDGRLGERSSG